MEAEIRYPTSLQDVIQLVQRLYQPGSPASIVKVQEILQQVQRSADGWTLANALLGNPDQQVQFFGALTFTVKLNSDWESLAEADVFFLLDTLINWIVRSVAEGATALVIKKLCSTLAVFFIRFPDKWIHCIRHLICCLCGHRVSPNDIDSCPSTTVLLEKASSAQKIVALWFCTIFLEEVSKLDSKNIKNQHYRDKVSINAREAVLLIAHAIALPEYSSDDEVDTALVIEGLQCFSSWAHNSIAPPAAIEKLKALNKAAMRWLQHSETFDTAAELITDALINYTSLFNEEDVNALFGILTGPWGVARFQEVLAEEGEIDPTQFIRLIIAFSEANVKRLAKRHSDLEAQTLMHMMHTMLTTPGYPVVENEISPQTFEFWSCLVEYLLDGEFMDEFEDQTDALLAIEQGKSHIFQAIQEYWRKIKIPPAEIADTWSKDSREGFTSFRKDFADLLETAYPLLHAPLFTQFVDHILSALPAHDWEDIEATMFCLKSLSDSLTDEPSEDDALEHLFGSPLFTLLSDSQAHIPLKARRTAVNLIGSYADFFERHSDFLPAVLNYLFTTLSAPSLARNASKSISQLCLSCRDTLTGELSTFLYQYEVFMNSPSADDFAKERVICAISYVIQALPTEEEKEQPILMLLRLIQKNVATCLSLVQHGQFDVGKELALSVLHCLTNMGRGLQVPDDIPIELDSEENGVRPLSFWEQEKGLIIQTQIVQIIQAIVVALKEDSEVVEAACCVFKTGFTESSPGAFVFPPYLTANFLLERAANCTRRVETIVTTAATMISSYSTEGAVSIVPQARALLNMVVTLVETYKDPQTDPDVAQSIVEFMNRMLSKYVEVFVNYEPKSRIELLFMFALNSVGVREPLVKKAACTFWSTLVSLRDDQPAVQAAIDSIVQACGPALAEKLLLGLGGGAARSEVDSLCEVLKKMVFRQPRTKAWLSAALFRLGFPSPKVTDQDKRLFLEKVISLRGSRGTNQIAKDFWVQSRGNEFAYGSVQLE